MLFLCPFSKAAWYSYPLFIKTEFIAKHHPSVADMIQTLLTSQHPKINGYYSLHILVVPLESTKRYFILQESKQAFTGIWSSKCNNQGNQFRRQQIYTSAKTREHTMANPNVFSNSSSST
jgi:hypothetical protein